MAPAWQESSAQPALVSPDIASLLVTCMHIRISSMCMQDALQHCCHSVCTHAHLDVFCLHAGHLPAVRLCLEPAAAQPEFLCLEGQRSLPPDPRGLCHQAAGHTHVLCTPQHPHHLPGAYVHCTDALGQSWDVASVLQGVECWCLCEHGVLRQDRHLDRQRGEPLLLITAFVSLLLLL